MILVVAVEARLASHYATRARLRLNAREVRQGEALLGFGEPLPRDAELSMLTLNLSRSGNLTEAAANLFAYMRAMDEAGVSAIAVAPIPHTGLGEAINDRLARAAAPHE